MGLSPAWQAEAVGFAWLNPHLRSRWPKYIGASCKVDLCGQLARIFLTVASSVPTWTTFLQSLPRMRRPPCSSHCLRRRSPPVFRRCALWIERHLHLSVGPLPEQKEQRIQAKALIDSRLRVIVRITPHNRPSILRYATSELLEAGRLPITNRRWNPPFAKNGYGTGADRLEEGQFAGGAEKLWQSRLVPMSIRAFELHRHEILSVNPVFTEQDGIRVFGATQRGCANECFFNLHRFEHFVEQRHELICPPRLEWNVYQQGERFATHLASRLGGGV